MRNINRQWILKKRPVGDIKPGDLELVETPLPECVEAPGTYPCWQLANNAMHCPAMNGATGLEVVVSYDASGTTPPPDGVNHVVSCQLCTNTTDPGCQ